MAVEHRLAPGDEGFLLEPAALPFPGTLHPAHQFPPGPVFRLPRSASILPGQFLQPLRRQSVGPSKGTGASGVSWFRSRLEKAASTALATESFS